MFLNNDIINIDIQRKINIWKTTSHFEMKS